MKWAYGVTTIPARRKTHLPATLASLEAAGFADPRLFVDGDPDAGSWRAEFDLEVTARHPATNAAANWWLSLVELYVRDPHADRFAIFQDDIALPKNLKAYLDANPWPEPGYTNLFSFRENDGLAKDRRGWFEGAALPQSGTDVLWQSGRGALALAFSNEAVRVLLSSRHMADRPACPIYGHRRLDGGVVTAMNKAGYREYVHGPSLVEHRGLVSTISKEGKGPGEKPKVWRTNATTFPGEGFDALLLLETCKKCQTPNT